jgi:hypothetical protein
MLIYLVCAAPRRNACEQIKMRVNKVSLVHKRSKLQGPIHTIKMRVNKVSPFSQICLSVQIVYKYM